MLIFLQACATAVADAPRDQAAVLDRPAAAEMGSNTLELEFDNSSPDHTVLTVAGPATDDMLRKVTNALNVLDRSVLHAKSLGNTGGVWRGRFTIQNDQDAQVRAWSWLSPYRGLRSRNACGAINDYVYW
jgi:hypothetical protein